MLQGIRCFLKTATGDGGGRVGRRGGAVVGEDAVGLKSRLKAPFGRREVRLRGLGLPNGVGILDTYVYGMAAYNRG